MTPSNSPNLIRREFANIAGEFLLRHRRPLIWLAATIDIVILTSLVVLIVKGLG